MYAILLAFLLPSIAFGQVCSVDSFVDNIKSFISSRVDTRFSSAETRLNTCETNHTSHFSSINLLTIDLNAAKDDITALRADVTSAENIISDHEARLTTLETLMSSIPTGSSTFKTVTQTAHGFAVGSWLYHNGTQYALADADAAASSYSIGVVSDVTDANTFTITTEGYVSGLSGLTAGVPHYISTTAGAITSTAPASNIKAVLTADSTTSGYVQQYEVGASSQALARYSVTRLLNTTGQQSVTSTTPAALNLSSGTVNMNIGSIVPVLASGQFTFPATSSDYRITVNTYSEDAGGTASGLILRMLINGTETVQSHVTATDTYNFGNTIDTVRTIPANAVVTFTVASSDGETLRVQGYDVNIVEQPSSVTVVTSTDGQWSSYTPTITATTTNPTFGTVTNNIGNYTIIGKTMILNYAFAQTSAGTSGSGEYQFSLPVGITLDTAKITTNPTYSGGSNTGLNGPGTIIGFGTVMTSGGDTVPVSIKAISSTQIAIISSINPPGNEAMASNNTTWNFSLTQLFVSFTITVPIL